MKGKILCKQILLISALLFSLVFINGCDNLKLPVSGEIAIRFASSLLKSDFNAAYILSNQDLKAILVAPDVAKVKWDALSLLLSAEIGQYSSHASPTFSILENNEVLYSFDVTFSKGKCTLTVLTQDLLVSDFKIINIEVYSSLLKRYFPSGIADISSNLMFNWLVLPI